jgi:hypothetical protein
VTTPDQNGKHDTGRVKRGNMKHTIAELLQQQENSAQINEQTPTMENSARECPPATQDISLNLANRQICVDKANYGPANPELENNDFWQKKADLFKTSIEEAKTMKCSNCAAFIIKEEMIKCIEKGICEENMNEAAQIVNLAKLGYCELFDFKCAGDRTCDAWITGGPLQ